MQPSISDIRDRFLKSTPFYTRSHTTDFHSANLGDLSSYCSGIITLSALADAVINMATAFETPGVDVVVQSFNVEMSICRHETDIEFSRRVQQEEGRRWNRFITKEYKDSDEYEQQLLADLAMKHGYELTKAASS